MLFWIINNNFSDSSNNAYSLRTRKDIMVSKLIQ